MIQPVYLWCCCVLWQHLSLLQVVAWCPKGSKEWSWHKERWNSADVSMPSHHLTAIWHSSGSRCKNWPGVGIIESHEEECGADTDNSLALWASELLLSRHLNWKSSMLDDSFFWQQLDTLYKGSIDVLQSNGHSPEKEWEGLVVMCGALQMPADISDQTERIRVLYNNIRTVYKVTHIANNSTT